MVDGVHVETRVVVQVDRAPLAELVHVALEDGLLGWREDLAVGGDGDPNTEASILPLSSDRSPASEKSCSVLASWQRCDETCLNKM